MLIFFLKDNTLNNDQCTCSNHVCNIFRWNEGCEDEVRNKLVMNTQMFEDLLTNMDENSDVDNCVDNLNKLLSDIFEGYTKSEINFQKHCDLCEVTNRKFSAKNDKPWFTDECKTLYNEYQRSIDSFNKYRSNDNRLILNLAKQRYKRLENKLKRQYKNQSGNMLSALRRKNPKRFYKKFKKRKNRVVHNITLEEFEDHFKNLISKENVQDDNHLTPEAVYEELDSPFTEAELDSCIKNLKRDKSTGFDNIMNEYIIMSRNLIKPVLCKLFNHILSTGDFPEIWMKSIVIPIFKKGQTNDPGNYRGISLVSHVGKLFTSMINARLTKWSEKNNILTDAQFGFRPGYGTTDAIFALHSLISKSLKRGKRFYCCFIDYKKAFDSVSHIKLWLRLVRCGITGKLLNVIKSMYSKLKCCVKLDGIFSNFFQSNVGLMKGESLSPLFILLCM